MKKEVALVFGITSNYTFALANTLLGLKKHNKKFWNDIIIYHDGIEDKEIRGIKKILPCKFIKFSDEYDFSNVPYEAREKYSDACFYRYACFDLLKKYKTVIWNDVDILIQKDIKGLLKYAENSGFAATQAMYPFMVENNFYTLIDKYKMFIPMYNSGIIVLRDNLPNYEKAFEWCIGKTIEYSNVLRWPDQGIINLYLQEFEVIVDEIDIDEYCCHPTMYDKAKNAAIIHAYGEQKFWNSIEYKKHYPEWVENNKKWIKITEEYKDHKTPLVSCIMSTYNRFDYLEEAVDSILNQTYKNIELIVVLEKSENQDLIEKILKSYNDDRIVIIKNSNRIGFPASLNIAMEISKGKYIARMDDDDISLPERFEKQVNFMEENPEIGISGTMAEIFMNGSGIIDVETDPEILKIVSLSRTPFCHPSVIFRKEYFNKFNLRYDTNYFTEDYELWSRAIQFFPISNIKEVLLKYRANEQGLTNGQKNEMEIHNSHKKVMRNQFQKYLELDLSDNELEVFQGRKNIMYGRSNIQAINDLKTKLFSKIIKNNSRIKFYNEKKLKIVLNVEHGNKRGFSFIIKKIIKRVFYPIYSRALDKILNSILLRTNDTNAYIFQRIGDIDLRLKNIESKNRKIK